RYPERWPGVVRDQVANAFSAAATAASIWPWLASGRLRIVSPVLGLRIASSVSVPASNFEPISIEVSIYVLRSFIGQSAVGNRQSKSRVVRLPIADCHVHFPAPAISPPSRVR